MSAATGASSWRNYCAGCRQSPCRDGRRGSCVRHEGKRSTAPRCIVMTRTRWSARRPGQPRTRAACDTCGHIGHGFAGDLAALDAVRAHLRTRHREATTPPAVPAGEPHGPKLWHDRHELVEILYVSPNPSTHPHRSAASCSCGWRTPAARLTVARRAGAKHLRAANRWHADHPRNSAGH